MTNLPDSSLELSALDLSVVVPCHNEALALPQLLPRLLAACRSACAHFEIIVVNDGSTDASWLTILTLAQSTPELVGLNLARRYGQQIALTAGLSRARGQRVLIIDADLQDPPELLSAMMVQMDKGADVVYGQRRSRAGEGLFKRLSAHLFYRLMKLAGDEALPPDAGDFRLMNRRVIDLLNQMPERQRFLRGMVAWIGLNQVALPYDREARAAGASKYPLRRMMGFAMDAMASFSTLPLRISLWIALGCAGLAFALLGYVLFAWLSGHVVEGWTSLACIMLFFFALQFFCIGMIGEYVGRIYVESKQRPLFIVSNSVGG